MNKYNENISYFIIQKQNIFYFFYKKKRKNTFGHLSLKKNKNHKIKWEL